MRKTHRRWYWLRAFLPALLILLFLAEAALADFGKVWAREAVSWAYARIWGGDLLDRYETEHFVIRYTTAGPNATTERYAHQVAADLESSLQRFLELGFRNPVILGEEEGRKIPVHITHMENAYGQSRQWWQLLGKLIRIEPWLTEDLRRATVAHELFHQVQNEYLGSTLFTAMRAHILSRWWLESSATYMESIVYPEAITYYYYIESYLLDGTYSRSLGESDSGYDTLLINATLAEAYHEPDDPTAVRDVLEQISWRTSAIQALGAVLARHGSSWTEFMQRHAIWSTMTGSWWQPGFFADGANYPNIAFGKGYRLTPTEPGAGEPALAVEPLAFETRQFVAAPGSHGRLTVTVQRESASGQGWVVAVAEPAPDQAAERVRAYPVTFPGGGQGPAVVTVPDFGVDGRRVMLLLSNGNPDGKERFSYTATLAAGM